MTDAANEGHAPSVAGRSLRAVTRFSAHHPVAVILVSVGLAILSTAYSFARLEFKTSRADLIDPKSEYQQRWLRYTEEFGDASDFVVTVEAEHPQAIEEVLEQLGQKVERETHLFKNVFYKVDPRKSDLRAKGLQYLSPRDLQMILGQLEEFGPVLRGNWGLMSLRNIFRNLRLRISTVQKEPPEIAGPAIEEMVKRIAVFAESMDRFITPPHEYQSAWPKVVPLDAAQFEAMSRVHYALNEKGTMGFLKAQPTGGTDNFSGASPAIDRLRQILADVGKHHPQARLGLTGIPVLESDEMRDSQSSMFDASVLSFIGVAILMVWGFRGLRHPLVSLFMLTIGMAWSFGFLTLFIGHLNILSVSFATMLLGLGIDYATVYLSQYVDLRHKGQSLQSSLLDSSESVGPGIVTAALSSAVAFFAAIFVDFAGVVELGIIAGGGIILCLVAAFTLLPATLAITDKFVEPRHLPNPFQGKSIQWLISRYPAWVTAVSCLGIVALGAYGLRVKYDYNLLNLQAKGLPSVDVQKRIFDQSDYPLLFAVSLAKDPREAIELKRKFEKLPTVHHVEEMASRLPVHKAEDTQLLIQGLQAQLAQLPAELPQPGEIDPAHIGEQMEELDKVLAELMSPTAARARESLNRFLDRLDELPLEAQMEILQKYQFASSSDLLAQMHMLASVANPEPITFADLPAALASRFVGPHSKQWLLQVYPKAEIWDIEPLTQFINDVRSVDPDATGTPLQTYEATREIKRSYELVGWYSLIVICVILLLDFRSIHDSILALVPVAAGGLLMFGILGWWDIDLNPANLIVLPLIVGLGVDGGIHMVHDYRLQKRRYATSSSTINALILNSTTTMVGFGAMMIAAHRGLYSLGLVLTIGVGCCLFVALVLLPAMLTLISRAQHHAHHRRSHLSPGPAPEPSFPHVPHTHGHHSPNVGYHPRSSTAE